MIKKKILAGVLGVALGSTQVGLAQPGLVPSPIVVPGTPAALNQTEPKAAPQLIPGLPAQPGNGVKMQMPTLVPGGPMLPPGGPGFAPGVVPGPVPYQQGGFQDPTPIGPGGPGANIATQPPPMPPYAWPTFAPYNNYSRIAYPLYYPYDAWPYIGPQYPFPKVPLGWRSVNLTWQDGHWYFHRTATGHDWWRIRYH